MNNLSILPNDNIADEPPAATPPPPLQRYVPPTWTYVKVLDLDMGFGTMVWFMVKWTFAAIPAACMVLLIMGMVFALLAALGVIPGSLGVK